MMWTESDDFTADEIEALLGQDPLTTAGEILTNALAAGRSLTLDEIVDFAGEGKVRTKGGPLVGKGYLLKFFNGDAEIFYKEDDTPEEIRFTIAHELGHWVLGLGRRDFSGGWVDPEQAQRSNRIEKWCDDFAEKMLERLG